jgi:hypothetical protein
MASDRVYYKGESGGFPQVRAMVSLMCPCCSWFVLAPKMLQLHINHLVWVLCRHVWMSEDYQLFLVPSWNSNTPLYPSKCYELGSVPRLFPLPLFSTWTHIWVPQGVGSASERAPTLYSSVVFNLDSHLNPSGSWEHVKLGSFQQGGVRPWQIYSL